MKKVKKLERDLAGMISIHRSLHDLHKQKRTRQTKKKASNVLRKADHIAHRIDKLKLGLAKTGNRARTRVKKTRR